MVKHSERLLQVILGLLLLLALVGCSDAAPDATSEDPIDETAAVSVEAGSSQEPDASPEAESDATETFDLSSANSAFAFGLYGTLRTEDGNLFLSPHSVSAALSMALVGARGETAGQMADVLGFGENAALVPAAFGRLDAELASRAQLPDNYEGDGFSLHVVNALWPHAGYPFEEAFIDALSMSFGAGLQALDYVADPEGARTTINDWVSEQTEERIEDLIPEGAISEGTRLVLTNAIYFNAPWLEPFDETATTIEPFVRLDGTPVGVDMMHRTDTMLYGAWDGGQAVEIPYNGNQLSMVILLPDEGAFQAFEEEVSAERFAEIVDALQTRNVSLGLPKFEFEDDASLVPNLKALGMTAAFDPNTADFSGITGERDLVISDVLHKAFVSVDEKGTEAAAATAVLFRATGIPAEPLEFLINRPFLFVIRDRETGSILFIGRVLDPDA